jgi:hypothetical protein
MAPRLESTYQADSQVPLPMFNWSGNKGSFKGQIPFYGKTGIEFYTERKVRYLVH